MGKGGNGFIDGGDVSGVGYMLGNTTLEDREICLMDTVAVDGKFSVESTKEKPNSILGSNFSKGGTSIEQIKPDYMKLLKASAFILMGAACAVGVVFSAAAAATMPCIAFLCPVLLFCGYKLMVKGFGYLK